MPSDPTTTKRQARRLGLEAAVAEAEFHSDEQACNCATERRLTKRQRFAVGLAVGGGKNAWKSSLRRLVNSHAAGPSHCLVLTQEPNQRYAQMILGHRGVRIEVSSNFYLTGDCRLGPSEEHHLEHLGFHTFEEIDPTEDRPKNWWIEQHPANPTWIAELITEVLVTVAAFNPYLPTVINMFGKDDPCLPCTWGDRS